MPQLSREDYKEKFLEFDSSGDGHLTYDEFKKHIRGLLRVEVSDAAVRNLFDSVNRGTDDYISLDEWLEALDKKSLKEVGDEELRATFSKLDASGDGRLTKSEMKNALAELNCSVSDENMNELFEAADSSGDGFISIDEFIEGFLKDMNN